MSTEKKLTAVEWLEEKLSMDSQNYYRDIIKQAKEKEKQQIIDAFESAKPLTNGKDYYNETYKK